MFGDPWVGTVKSLVIVYQYDNAKPVVVYASENNVISIVQPDSCHLEAWNPPSSEEFVIAGAAYGLADSTKQVQSLVRQKKAGIYATNEVFGDSWFGTVKTLVVVYRDSSFSSKTYRVAIAIEGYAISTAPFRWQSWPSHPHLNIIEAAYGKLDVTRKVKDIVHQEGGSLLVVNGSDIVFGGNSNYGRDEKTLVVVYRYGKNAAQLAITEENAIMAVAFDGDQEILPLQHN